MTRICIIGDSHVGALKYGWDDVHDRYPGVELTFFATPGAYTGDIVLDAGTLTGRTDKVRETFAYSSGGSKAIVPGDYDRFVLVAMGVGLRTVLTLYTRYRLDGHRGYKAPNFVTRTLFLDLARTALGNSNAMRLRTLLGSVSEAPISIVPEPLPSEDLPTTESYDESLRMIFTGGFDSDLAAIYESLLDEIRAGGTEILPQAEATKKSPSLTKRQYCTGSIRVSGTPRPSEERLHMNNLFGVEVLGTYLGRPEAG